MTFVAGQTLTAAQLNDLDIDSLVVDTDVLVVDKTNNRVGIGTSSPAEELHVLKDQDGDLTQMLVENLDQRVRIGAYYEAGVAQFAKIQSEADNGTDQPLVLNPEGGNVGIGTNFPSATLDIDGSLSKNSGSFKIPHPLPSMTETHNLVHSFVEAPQADNLYRGQVTLSGGAAAVDLDVAAGMTDGTFELLNRELQCFVVNNEGWTAVRGSVSGSTLTIEAQDASCADTVDWLVIGERHDQHMYDTEWTDDDGRVIVEPLRPAEPEPGPEPIQDVETEVTATEAP